MEKIKYFLIFLLVAGFSLPAVSQVKHPGDKKIKSVIVTEEKSDMLVKKAYKDSETYYDPTGNVIEEITYKDGKVNKHFKYQYDQDNNKIREDELDSAGRLIESSEYKYAEGLRVEKVVYDGNKKVKLRKVYTYTKY